MEKTPIRNVTIIGAGQAGLHTADELRKRGFDGVIRLLGDEGYAPYQRPPLSKTFLKGKIEEARLTFRPGSFYVDQRIDCRFSSAAISIDTSAQQVNCSDGESVSYDRLVIATGATPIELPITGAALAGVISLRGLDDSKVLRRALADASRLLIIGGGYIGLEVAAAARQLGAAVTVVERMPRLLSRVTSAPVSDFFLDLHREHGVDVLLDESVKEIAGADKVSGVKLASGPSIPADTVLVGIGVWPNQELAEAAGIDCDDGILVDTDCRTSNALIYAAGDCARSVQPDRSTLRLESVHNALDQGERIAAAIMGDDRPPFDPPWFWSDQYDIKLQTVGLFNERDDIAIRGDVGSKKFAALYFRNDVLTAIDAVNDPIAFIAGKQLFKKGIKVNRETATNPAITLKELVPKPAGRAPTD